ncbi:MAG: hypothetical protein QG561_326 [Patescibacteria group bacterium]|nr:hypothetical protein [Patescibacteria group bacterium]
MSEDILQNARISYNKFDVNSIICYTLRISHKNTTMTTDITHMGPHALASYHSRALALASFGIDPTTMTLFKNQGRSLAKQSRTKRALMVQEDHQIMAQPKVDTAKHR